MLTIDGPDSRWFEGQFFFFTFSRLADMQYDTHLLCQAPVAPG